MKNLYRDLVTTASKDAVDNSVHVLHLTMPDVRAVIELIEALRELHDGNAEYSSINQLGAYKNHDMRRARNALYEVGGSFAPEDTWARTAQPERKVYSGDMGDAPAAMAGGLYVAEPNRHRPVENLKLRPGDVFWAKPGETLEQAERRREAWRRGLEHACHAECNCIRTAGGRLA